MSDAVLISLIGGGVTLVGGVITFLTVWLRLRFARNNPTEVVDTEVLDAEERYGADPRMFVKDIMDDRRQYREEVQSLRTEVGSLRTELENFRTADRKFRGALARWFLDIMAAFDLAQVDMPYPALADRPLLADVIPPALEARQPVADTH